MKLSKRDKIIMKIIDTIGGICFWVGLIALAGAVETGEGFMIASSIFGVGFGVAIWIVNR